MNKFDVGMLAFDFVNYQDVWVYPTVDRDTLFWRPAVDEGFRLNYWLLYKGVRDAELVPPGAIREPGRYHVCLASPMFDSRDAYVGCSYSEIIGVPVFSTMVQVTDWYRANKHQYEDEDPDPDCSVIMVFDNITGKYTFPYLPLPPAVPMPVVDWSPNDFIDETDPFLD